MRFIGGDALKKFSFVGVEAMVTRKLRVLIARFGEGYEEAMLKLAEACSKAGFEVIYTNAQDPKAIVSSAIQESADHIGITTLPGASVQDFVELFEELRTQGATDVRVTAGGLFPQEDVDRIKQLGLLDFYPRGSIYEKIERWTQEHGTTAES